MVKYKLTFSKEEIKSTTEKIKTKKSKIKYLTFLSDSLGKIFFDYSDVETIKLLKEYKLIDKFSENIGSKDESTIIERFRNWLNEEIRPFVGNSKILLKYDFDNSRYESEQKELDEKYPTKDFKESEIIYFCNKNFPDYNERIAYLEYVILKFKQFFRNNAHEIFFDAIERPELIYFVSNIQTEIEKLKKESILLNFSNKNSKRFNTSNLQKFQWIDTEESILRIFDLLQNCNFLTFKNKTATLRDTFLNKDGKPFSNTQLNTVYSEMDLKKIIKKTDPEFDKFDKLLNQLKRILET